MTKLDKVVNQIKELRSSTNQVQEDKSFTNSETVAACHELHTALDRYQEILTRIKES